MAKNRSALLLLLLVSSSLFLLCDAQPLASPATKVVLRKGGSSGGLRSGSGGRSVPRGAGRNNGSPKGPGNVRSRPIPGRTIPLIPQYNHPKSSSDEQKSSAAHGGYSCSLTALLVIIGLWI